MKMQTMKNIPAGANPFNHDLVNMGMSVGKNVVVMMSNFDKDFCHHMIVIDKTTGNRMKVTFAPEVEDAKDDGVDWGTHTFPVVG